MAERLTDQPKTTYPGGSKERVRRAGEAVRAGNPSSEDLAVIDSWRAAHRQVLNTFQAILRIRTKGMNILVAQRHKRKNTIFGKLQRYSRMALNRMDDVAGCRLIFDDLSDLYAFREEFHRARFKHKRRNEIDKYDYVKRPNPLAGYRGIHDIYEYDVNSKYAEQYRGLMIEIQYRTRYQHAWATCVEVIGFITESQPKFREGDLRFQRIMQLASEVIARAFEGAKSSLPDLSNKELLQEFSNLDEELGFLSLLSVINESDTKAIENGTIILHFRPGGALEIDSYRSATEALRALFKLERDQGKSDAVLVRADSSAEIREAFKNYFSDAKDFLSLIDEGCGRLSGTSIINRRSKKTRKRSPSNDEIKTPIQ